MSTKNPDRRAFFSLLRVMFKGESRANGGLGTALGNSKSRRRKRLGRGSAKKAATVQKQGAKVNLKSKIGSGFKYLSICLGFAVLAFLTGSQGYMMGLLGIPLTQIFTTAVLILTIFNLLLGPLNTISYFYYVKDIPFYLSLPFSSRQILRAKFIHSGSMSILSNLIFLPLFLVPAYMARLGVLRLILYALFYLTIAACINIFIICIEIILVRFSNFAHNQDRFMMIFSTLSMVFAIAFGIGVQFVSNDPVNMQGQIAKSVSSLSGAFLVQLLLKLFALPIVFTKLVFSSSLLKLCAGLIGACLIVAIYYLIFLFLGDRYYLDGVMSVQKSGGNKSSRVYQKSELKGLISSRSPLKAMISNELIKLRRTPIFFSQNLIGPLTMPLYLIAVFLVVSFLQLRNKLSISEAVAMLRAQTGGLNLNHPMLLFVTVGIYLMTVLMAGTSLHSLKMSISSDGENFFFYKCLPVKTRVYLLAKALIYGVIATLPLILIILLAGLFLALPPLSLAYLILTFILLMTMLSHVMLAIGALYPILQWDNETVLIRGGKNVLWIYLEILISLCLVLPSSLILIFNYKWAYLPLWLGHLIALAVLVLGVVCSIFFCYGYAARKLERTES
ncbi:MAG: hypothetical protein Q4P08_06070 [Eubacteriales bacterium]|nr:hypothetical protein [Eubacteriales bacterium]